MWIWRTIRVAVGGGCSGDDGFIGRYIFSTTLGALLVVLVGLTAVIWVEFSIDGGLRVAQRAARLRPDDQPRQDHPGVCRNYRPDRPAVDSSDRALCRRTADSYMGAL